MAINTNPISLILLIVLMLWNGARAQSGCTTAIVSLSPCLNYVSGNSSTPSSSCCSSLTSVVQSRPQCLCTLLKGGASTLGIAINQTTALDLPRACNVQTPPVSQCNAVNGPTTSGPAPATSPSASPADDIPEVPETPSDSDPDIPPDTGSKTVPRTDGASVGGTNKGATFSFIGIVLLIASSFAFSGIGLSK